MNWTRVGLLTLAAVVAVIAMMPAVAHADRPAPVDLGPVFAAPPEAATYDGVVNADIFAEIAEITQRIEPYLYVDADGFVQLRDVTAAELGVSEEFLANYREAMTYSNEVIAAGELTVAPDLTVSTTEQFFDEMPGVPGIGAEIEGGAAMPDADVPEWGAWNYGYGGMFYNSYQDWTYYRTRYYGLCNSMASYLGLPWMSQSLLRFYGYNQSYFNRYCYNNFGTYYYLPYNYCQGAFGYKPAYFWTRSCCSGGGYNWGWSGFWCRY